METTDDMKAVIRQIRSGGVDYEELKKYVTGGTAFERVAALKQLASQYPSDDAVSVFREAIGDPRNSVKLMGRSVKIIAIAALVEMKNKQALELFRSTSKTLSQSESEDLSFHLESEGVTMP